MLYLISYSLDFKKMEYRDISWALSDIVEASKNGDLISALHEESAELLTGILAETTSYESIIIPPIEEEHFDDASPADVAITLGDNLEIGDDVIYVEDINDAVMFFKYTEWE